jgi:hypothetical protein
MTGRVLIRKYRGSDDDPEIERIVNAGSMSTVFPFFLGMATREFVSQVSSYSIYSKTNNFYETMQY